MSVVHYFKLLAAVVCDCTDAAVRSFDHHLQILQLLVTLLH